MKSLSLLSIKFHFFFKISFSLERQLTDFIVTISPVIYGSGFPLQLTRINQFSCFFFFVINSCINETRLMAEPYSHGLSPNSENLLCCGAVLALRDSKMHEIALLLGNV